MEHTVFGAEIGGYIGNMPQKSQKKSEQILIMVVPETFAEVKMIAKREDRPLGYVARELMHRGLGLYRRDGLLKDAQAPMPPLAIPADEFDLEQAVETGNDPFRIMTDWFAAEGRSLPRDYGVIFFAGWESYSPEEKLDALRDARKVLERTLKAAGPAEVKPFPLTDDMPSKQSIQKMLEEVELEPPRKRKTK